MSFAHPARRKINVLLVDDQPNNLLALEAMLAEMDLNLVRAESGDEALRQLLHRDFAVILLDVQMPGMDGFETAGLIRQRDRSRSTPIIFVTALSRSETNVFKGYSLGAVDYLFKPVVPEILRSKVAVFVDLYRKNEAIREGASDLERLSRQNELILNSAADGVLGSDRNERVTFANPSAARMLGTRAEALSGRDIHEILHPDSGESPCDITNCRLRAALAGDVTSEMQDDLFQRTDGAIFPVEYSATPMRTEDGGLIGTVLTFRDVTERRAAAMAEENERLYREAQEANKAKDDFLATLSHELRTPMTAILGWLEILRMGETDQATIDEALATIWSSAKAQAQLIDDMLDVSRIVMNKFEVELKPEDLSRLVSEAIEAVRLVATQKGLHIQYVPPPGQVRTIGDGRRLRQVIWNLLSNAIKFTGPEGSINVTLSVEQNMASISVSDTGHGIGHEFLPHVFDRLKQADSAKNVGGLGLGLAIARHIVELHHGTIEAFSAGPGRGATFVVRLPLFTETMNAEQSRSHSLV